MYNGRREAIPKELPKGQYDHNSKSTIKNQLGKATDRPTLRWIFQCFQCIHLVILNQEEHISNWNKDRDFILSLLPDDCFRYYQLVT
jgi:hypothetical protein